MVEVHAKLNAVGFVFSAGGVMVIVPPATLAAATPAPFIVMVITPVAFSYRSVGEFSTHRSATVGEVASPG